MRPRSPCKTRFQYHPHLWVIVSHRAGHAQLTHPAPLIIDSLHWLRPPSPSVRCSTELGRVVLSGAWVVGIASTVCCTMPSSYDVSAFFSSAISSIPIRRLDETASVGGSFPPRRNRCNGHAGTVRDAGIGV